MTTGYICIIEEKLDVTLRDFVLRCAHAFGPVAHQRDEGLDSPLRAPEMDPDVAKDLTRAEARLREAEGMTLAQAEVLAEAQFAAAKKWAQEIEWSRAATGSRYRAMLAKVEAWNPPTPDHQGLKDFMVEQIRGSMSDYVPPDPLRVSAEAWLAAAVESASEDVTRLRVRLAKEEKNVAFAKAWIEALVASVPE